MAARIPRVRGRLEEYDADALLLSSLPNIRWSCGFTGSNALLLVTEKDAWFVTDGRYTQQARQEVDGANILIASEGLMERLLEENVFDSLRRVVFQADDVTVSVYQQLTEACADIDWIPESTVLTRLVGEKEEQEIRRIRRAQSLTEAVYEHVLDVVAPGMTERELAAEITYQHLKRGAEKMAFDPIVASGPNGARPHARPTDRMLQSGDFVVLDMGCVLDGYASDMTRTIGIGDPSDAARKGYQVVKAAQAEALSAARAGMKGKELDAVAREVIDDAGYGDYFAHGLGHGIGLEVHEWPRVSHSVEDELPAGACVTIEPGIYLPEEGFGVRIEDIIVLQSDGCQNLTQADKDLHIVSP